MRQVGSNFSGYLNEGIDFVVALKVTILGNNLRRNLLCALTRQLHLHGLAKI